MAANGVDRPSRWRRTTSIEMIASGAIGLIASFVLSIEAWKLAANSKATFSCDVNTVLSCSTVASTWQSRILGFPNAFLGILFEAVVLSISVATLAGVKFPRWYMLATEALYTIAILFAWWLFIQSFFVIRALCPWCLLITITTTLVWAGLTRINIHDGVLTKRKGVQDFVNYNTDWYITGLVILIILAMIAIELIPSFL